jgi:aminobenzoyl-glutamate utilization protein A
VINRAHFSEAITWRRNLHRLAQPSWLEFYATGLIASHLTAWGYEVKLGTEIFDPSKQLLPPSAERLAEEYNRALAAGIKEEFILPAKGGYTGVVGILRGTSPGPTVAYRFDIDSNEARESQEKSHRPAADGFASTVPRCAHLCGHDGHVAMGLLLARHFSENRAKIKGTVKFIFQPNEENLSGAAAMIPKGVLDGVDFLLGGHLGVAVPETGKIAIDVHSSLAVTRSEVTFRGKPSHSGTRPDLGKNALLGACAAITNLYAIARHGLGPSRINVGVIEGGSTWNVIPERVYFKMETRAIENSINDYMQAKAREVLSGAAKMYDLKLEVVPAASCPSGHNSPELVAIGLEVAKKLPWVKEVIPDIAWFGSEDFMLMAEVVQKQGGQVLFVLHGTPIGGGHHSETFDFDEEAIYNGADFYAAMYDTLTSR